MDMMTVCVRDNTEMTDHSKSSCQVLLETEVIEIPNVVKETLEANIENYIVIRGCRDTGENVIVLYTIIIYSQWYITVWTCIIRVTILKKVSLNCWI